MSSGRQRDLVRLVPAPERGEDGDEEFWGQEPIIVSVAASRSPEIVSRPDKLIAFADDNPRSLVVETKVLFHGTWNFYGGAGIIGPAVSDRQHSNQCLAVRLALDSQGNDTGSVLAPFLMSVLRLVRP